MSWMILENDNSRAHLLDLSHRFDSKYCHNLIGFLSSYCIVVEMSFSTLAWDNFAFNFPNTTAVISNSTRTIPATANKTTTTTATVVLNYYYCEREATFQLIIAKCKLIIASIICSFILLQYSRYKYS